MPDTDTMKKQRWTDHWEVKALVGSLLGTISIALAGGTWLVSKVVAQEAINVKHETMQTEIIRRLDEIKDDVKDLKKK